MVAAKRTRTRRCSSWKSSKGDAGILWSSPWICLLHASSVSSLRIGRKVIKADQLGDALQGVTSPTSPALDPLKINATRHFQNSVTSKGDENSNDLRCVWTSIWTCSWVAATPTLRAERWWWRLVENNTAARWTAPEVWLGGNLVQRRFRSYFVIRGLFHSVPLLLSKSAHINHRCKIKGIRPLSLPARCSTSCFSDPIHGQHYYPHLH